MSYDSVDHVINIWLAKHDFKLFQEFGGKPARFIYLSSNEGECCQIAINLPNADKIDIYASDVETRNDEEMQMHWQVQIGALEEALENAVISVRKWFRR